MRVGRLDRAVRVDAAAVARVAVGRSEISPPPGLGAVVDVVAGAVVVEVVLVVAGLALLGLGLDASSCSVGVVEMIVVVSPPPQPAIASAD